MLESWGLPNLQIILAALLLAICFLTPQQDPSPALAGIAHVAFRVADVPKSRDFYRALGFEEAFEFTDPGKPPVSYIKINDRQFIELYGRSSQSQPTGLLHVCYETSDIESLWSEYVKRGLRPPQARKARAGNLLFVFHDPEGQTLEYTQYLPGSLHFEDRGKHLSNRRVSTHLLRAVIPSRDVNGEHAFYTSKLKFRDLFAHGAVRMRLPGDSGQEIGLEYAASDAKPRIAFAVADLSLAEDELRRRSFALKSAAGSISVVDPDGAVIMFIPEMHASQE